MAEEPTAKPESMHWLRSILESPPATLRALILILLLPFVATLGVLLAIGLAKRWLGPGEITITPQNAVTIRLGAKNTSVFLLSANGGDDGPWVNTGIEVEEGASVTIRASGRVCTVAHHLIEAANENELPPSPWVGPEGLGPTYPRPYVTRGADLFRQQFFLSPHENPGKLLGRIAPKYADPASKDDGVIAVGDRRSFKAKRAGTLWLAVNDIWLTPSMENAWAPDVEKARDFYLYQIERWDREAQARTLREADKRALIDDLLWTPEPGVPKWALFSAREIKVNQWKNLIVNRRYWNVWYDDNAGSFQVTVESEKP